MAAPQPQAPQPVLQNVSRSMRPLRLILLVIVFSLTGSAAHRVWGEDLKAAVRVAFAATANGYSSDEVLLSESRCENFVAAVQQRCPQATFDEACAALLRLRKAGDLPAQTTRRGPPLDTQVKPIAEIAARQLIDQHETTTDQILCSARLRTQLQEAAERIAPGVDRYQVRKAMIALRKQRRLRPELVLRVANWERDVQVFTPESARKDWNQIPATPGVYLFRDATGYLYIGEAVDLRQRLQEHLQGSDRIALAAYLQQHAEDDLTIELHAFPPDSPAKKVTIRRAYESELIRSREPRLNVRP